MTCSFNNISAISTLSEKTLHLRSLAGFALWLHLGHLSFQLTLLITFSVPVKGNKLFGRCSITSPSDVSVLILSHIKYRQLFCLHILWPSKTVSEMLHVWRPHKFLARRQKTQFKAEATLTELILDLYLDGKKFALYWLESFRHNCTFD